MNIQANQPFRVVYDQDKNKYYRVNKVTGEIHPSYKTGKLPAKFYPQVTGTDYLARKRSNGSDNFENSFRSGKVSNLTNYGKKFHTQFAEKSLQKTKQTFSITQPVNQKSHTTDMKRTFRNTDHSNVMKDDSKNVSFLLPKLKRPDSFFLLESENVSKKLANSSISQFMENSNQTKKPKVIDSFNQINKDDFTINPKTKLKTSYNDDPQYKQPQSNRLQNKLRRYCEIKQLKINENNFKPLQNNQKSQRFQKFTDKTLLTSMLDDSRLSLEPANRRNPIFLSVNRKERNAITRNDVAKSIDLLEKQNASLLLLAKKCQKTSQFSIQRSPHSKSRKSPQARPPILNLQNLQQQQKLKSLIQKQKQTFLFFYPKYMFKQNVRLIQQQKDRKINLKKLQQSFLENGQKKYGKIYHAETQQAKETI